MFLEKMEKTLESEWALLGIFLVAFFLWLFNQSVASVCVLVLFVCAVFLFCEDVKNIFGPVFFAGFFIKDILTTNESGETVIDRTTMTIYVVCIAVAIISMISFLIINIRKNKSKIKLGGFFFPLVFADIGFILAGVVGNFNLLAMIITVAFCLAILLLYFVAVNFTKNLGEYLAFLLLFGAVFIVIEKTFYNALETGSLSKIFNQEGWFAAESPNTAAIFVLLGIISCFYLGHEKKFGYLMLIPSVILLFFLLTLRCRGVLLTAVIILIPLIIYEFFTSKEKMQFLMTALGIVFILIIVEICSGLITKTVQQIIDKMVLGTTGRTGDDGLWRWCFEKFKQYPIFGYGFITKNGESVPSIRAGVNNFIHAHNTILQWATSTGIVGMLLMAWFYFRKYKLTLVSFKRNVFLPCFILSIAMSGMVDQAAAMDTFVFIMPIIMLAATEEIFDYPFPVHISPKTAFTFKDKSKEKVT